MNEQTFTLPSGCQIALRQIMLREENMLAEAIKAKRGSTMQSLYKVLNECTVEIVEPGPYEFLSSGGRPDWNNMLAGDMMATMIHLRVLSYKEREIYTVFNVPCQQCGRKDSYEINLYEDMIWRDLSEEGRKKLINKEPFEVSINDTLIKFHMVTGNTQNKVDKLTRQFPGRPVSAGLRARIESVENVDVAHIMDWLDGGNNEKYTGLSSDDAEALRDAFDLVECGIDTEVELCCPDGHEFLIDLPFGVGFLAPSKEIQRRKFERRRGKTFSVG